MKTIFRTLVVFMLFAGIGSCTKPKLDFSIETDPTRPGLLILKNESLKYKDFTWEFGRSGANGSVTMSPGDISYASSPSYYPGNGNLAITLSGSYLLDENSITKKYVMTSTPSSATITSATIKRLTTTRANGTAYDDNDGTQPDLAIIACNQFCAYGQNISPEPGTVHYNMSGISFPYTHSLGTGFVVNNFSPQTHDFEFFIVDYDNPSFGIYEIMAYLKFNPYELTYSYSGHPQECYPSQLTVSNEQAEVTFSILWQY